MSVDEKETPQHVDFFGRPLVAGDTVAFTVPNYRELTLATVVAMTLAKVRVEYRIGEGMLRTYLGLPSFFIKRDT